MLITLKSEIERIFNVSTPWGEEKVICFYGQLFVQTDTYRQLDEAIADCQRDRSQRTRRSQFVVHFAQYRECESPQNSSGIRQKRDDRPRIRRACQTSQVLAKSGHAPYPKSRRSDVSTLASAFAIGCGEFTKLRLDWIKNSCLTSFIGHHAVNFSQFARFIRSPCQAFSTAKRSQTTLRTVNPLWKKAGTIPSAI
jgi:hypothetical protein